MGEQVVKGAIVFLRLRAMTGVKITVRTWVYDDTSSRKFFLNTAEIISNLCIW